MLGDFPGLDVCGRVRRSLTSLCSLCLAALATSAFSACASDDGASEAAGAGGSSGGGAPCQTAADCPPGGVCSAAKRCIATGQCRTDADCGAGMLCSATRSCVPIGSCDSDQDCQQAFICGAEVGGKRVCEPAGGRSAQGDVVRAVMQSSAGIAKCGAEVRRIAEWVLDVPDTEPQGVGSPPTIAVGGDHLFYLLIWRPLTVPKSPEGPAGLVMRVPIRGGPRVRIADVVGSGSSVGRGLAVSRSAVVFSQGVDGGAGEIVSVPTSGGDPTILARTSGVASTLVADEANVYFVDGEGTKSVPLAGGSVRMLTTLRTFSIMVSGGFLYLAQVSGPHALFSVPVGGGPLTLLVTDPDGALAPVICGSDLCYMTPSTMDSRLKRATSNGSVPEVLAHGFVKPHYLQFDGVSFFFSAGGPGSSLHRVPAAGGELTFFYQEALGIALDDTCLYWSNFEGIHSLALNAARAAPGVPSSR